MAKIEIVHIPIKTGVTGASHQFLLLTRDDGSREFIRGGPQFSPKIPEIMISAVLGQSPFGRLVVHAGAYDSRTRDYPMKETSLGLRFDEDLFRSWKKTHVLRERDEIVEHVWSGLKSTARKIAMRNLPYLPLSQNSNSLASECLRLHHLEPRENSSGYPWGYKFNAPTWTPGSDNRLTSQKNQPGTNNNHGDGNGKENRQEEVQRLYEAYKKFEKNISLKNNRQCLGGKSCREGYGYGG